MAMTFSSQGCREAANNLNTSARNLDSLLNSELSGIIEKVKTVYDSEAAQELYDAFAKMKAKFPEFIKSVTDCSDYLTNKVAPAYEKLESTVSSKIG